MRLLFAGMWLSDLYEAACFSALAETGAELVPFCWNGYFRTALGKCECKYVLPGPCVYQLNSDFLACAERVQPDVVFVWRGTHIFPSTLLAIRARTRATLVSYNTDDPFSPAWQSGPIHWRRLWRYFIPTIPCYDLHFVFRQLNVEEYRHAGAADVRVLLPYYLYPA